MLSSLLDVCKYIKDKNADSLFDNIFNSWGCFANYIIIIEQALQSQKFVEKKSQKFIEQKLQSLLWEDF